MPSAVDDVTAAELTETRTGVWAVSSALVTDERDGVWAITTALVVGPGVVAETYTEGPPGPPGPVGIVVVQHGSDSSTARPTAPIVYWVGTATPVNAEPYDFWKND